MRSRNHAVTDLKVTKGEKYRENHFSPPGQGLATKQDGLTSQGA